MKVLISIAWRNIWRNKLRSMVIISAVAAGLVGGVFILSFTWGMHSQRIEQAIRLEVGHIQIHHPQFKEDPQVYYGISPEPVKYLDTLSSIAAYAPRIVVSAMISSARGNSGVRVNGIVYEKENKVSQFESKLIEGSIQKNYRRLPPIYISEAVAQKLKVTMRKKVVLTFQDVNHEIVNAAFRVRGIFKTNNSAWDKQNVFVPLEALQAPTGSRQINEVAILLHDDRDIGAVQGLLQSLFRGYLVETWSEIMPELKLAIDSFNQVMYILMFIILLTLAFGIINTMLMAVLERTREIGMLMAVGMNKGKIFFMIMTESLCLSLLGAPMGLLGAYLLIAYLSHTGIDLSAYAHGLSSFGYEAVVYPAMQPSFYRDIGIEVFIVALLSSIYPAYKAIRLSPLEAIRKV